MNLLHKLYNIFHIKGFKGFATPIKIRLRLILFELQKILNVKRIRSFYGGIDLITDGWIDRTLAIYYSGAEGDYYVLHLKKVSKEFYFLDIGANVGFYSILAAKNDKCKLVYAFEPIPNVCKKIKNNAYLNGVEDKIVIIEKAISDVDGKLKIHFNEKLSGESSLHYKGEKTNLIDISSINFMELNNIDLPNGVSVVVKIDVEGHELLVIEELFKSNLGKAIKEIFYEVDHRWVNPNAIKALLEKNGFLKFEKIGSREYHYDIHAIK